MSVFVLYIAIKNDGTIQSYPYEGRTRAAYGKLYLTMKNGSVICLGAE